MKVWMTSVAMAVLSLTVMAQPAQADPTAEDAFLARLRQSVAQSAVFKPGTTLSVFDRELNSDIDGSMWPSVLESTVNPDGSLNATWSGRGSRSSFRCVSMKRCWRREGRNDHWHALAPDALNRIRPNAEYFMPIPIAAQPGSTFDITRVDGADVFTTVVPAPAGIYRQTWIISPQRMVIHLEVAVQSGRTVVLWDATFRAVDSALPITAPAPSQVSTADEERYGIEVLTNGRTDQT